jgi:putative addiction module killer protein
VFPLTFVAYKLHIFMVEIRQTDAYSDWFDGLKDQRAKARIDIRIRRLSLANPGDVAPVGGGIREMRIPYGPGYRVYFIRRGATLVVPLCGGDKSTQAADIKRAKELANQLET